MRDDLIRSKKNLTFSEEIFSCSNGIETGHRNGDEFGLFGKAKGSSGAGNI